MQFVLVDDSYFAFPVEKDGELLVQPRRSKDLSGTSLVEINQ